MLVRLILVVLGVLVMAVEAAISPDPGIGFAVGLTLTIGAGLYSPRRRG